MAIRLPRQMLLRRIRHRLNNSLLLMSVGCSKGLTSHALFLQQMRPEALCDNNDCMTASQDETDDERLLRAIAEGSREAFAILVKRHSSRFYSVAYRYMAQRQEAEDMVQEAFIKLWQRPDMWAADRKVKFTTWFYRVVINLCLDAKKKKRAAAWPETLDIEDDRPLQDKTMEDKQGEALLEKAISELPERQRTALNLCFYEGLSNQEAADVMELNLKALQSLLMRAKLALRERMKIGGYAA